MRKILSVTFTLILCLMLIAPAWGEEDALNGYLWEQTSEKIKIPLMAGFIHGHDAGFVYALANSNMSEVELLLIFLRYRKKGGKTSSYNTKDYVKEVDAFLQTYPLCKKNNVMDTIGLLAMVWWSEESDIKHRTYKEVGEGCSK